MLIGQTDKPVYLDHTKPVEVRVRDLMSRMTLEEKAIFLNHVGPDITRFEGGQFAVIATAAAATWWAWKKPWYRQRVVIPMSALIACMGIFWAVQRTAGFGTEA